MEAWLRKGRVAWAGPRVCTSAGIAKVRLHTGVARAAVLLAVLGWGRDSGGPLADGRLGGLGR